MKKLVILFFVFACAGLYAQTPTKKEAKEERKQRYIEEVNPFRKNGYRPRIITLSNGKYREAFPDTIVQIGSFTYNKKAKKITGIWTTEELGYSEATLKPDLVSRWFSPDPLSEEFTSWSPYNFGLNNPIIYVDPDGRLAIPFTDLFDKNGNKIGDDGVDNGVNIVVNNDQLAKQVKSVYKKDGTVSLLDDQFTLSAGDVTALPSDTVLGEALNVLDRTIANGGLSEESSIVYNNGTIIQAPKGDPVELGSDTHAETKLPMLIPTTTPADVEATIHSHPTEAKVVGNQVYGGNARETTPSDATTFSRYRTNIIVGPLGRATATTGIDRQTGRNGTTIKKPNNGVVIYNNGGTKASFEFTARQVRKIIKN